MIDEVKLAEIRASWDASNQDVHFFSRADFDAMAGTIDQLWLVARAARRWQKAMPGRHASDAESELALLLDALPALRDGGDQ